MILSPNIILEYYSCKYKSHVYSICFPDITGGNDIMLQAVTTRFFIKIINTRITLQMSSKQNKKKSYQFIDRFSFTFSAIDLIDLIVISRYCMRINDCARSRWHNRGHNNKQVSWINSNRKNDLHARHDFNSYTHSECIIAHKTRKLTCLFFSILIKFNLLYCNQHTYVGRIDSCSNSRAIKWLLGNFYETVTYVY